MKECVNKCDFSTLKYRVKKRVVRNLNSSSNLNQKKKKGFTLVEMILVITIISILASISYVKFGKVQENAKLSADYTNAANIATAANIAMSDDPNLSSNIQVSDLTSKGYLSNVPKSMTSPSSDFVLKIETNGEVKVMLGEKQMYPKVD
ncbi:MAG: type II secretion system GspH family protein [Clostridioides sp.]|jgi:type IV pilus assembly protein PilA|nr:type II secretion system GspH family protein [Clostridioides sp.]